MDKNKIIKSEDDWKKELSPEEYNVLRKKATEAPFSGEYYRSKENGMYLCRACGNELFSSDAKYDSGSGWPSFFKPAQNESIQYHDDSSLSTERTEIICVRCGSHLGHVFDDGPKPTGKRFCINSISLKLKKKK